MTLLQKLDMWAQAVLREDNTLAADILAELDACYLRRCAYREDVLHNALMQAADKVRV